MKRNNNEPYTEQNKKSGNIFSKTIRAVSAIIVFGIPLAVGTGVMVGYGACKAYKKLKRQHP